MNKKNILVCETVFPLLHYGVTDSAVAHGVHVSEVISGHNAAGRPLCYHSLADLRSAMCAASPGTSGSFFSPLVSTSASCSAAPTDPRLSHHHCTHPLTEEGQHDLSHVIEGETPKHIEQTEKAQFPSLPPVNMTKNVQFCGKSINVVFVVICILYYLSAVLVPFLNCPSRGNL